METKARPPPLTGPYLSWTHPPSSQLHETELNGSKPLKPQESTLGSMMSAGPHMNFHPTSFVTPLSPDDYNGEMCEEKPHLSPKHDTLKHKQSRVNSATQQQAIKKITKPSVLSADAPPFTPQCLRQIASPASPAEHQRQLWLKRNAPRHTTGQNHPTLNRLMHCQAPVSTQTGKPASSPWEKEYHASIGDPTDDVRCANSRLQSATASPLKYFKFLVAEDVAGFLVGRRGAGIEEFQKRNGPGLKVSVSKRGELFPHLFERIAVAVGVGEGFGRAVREVSQVVLERAMHKEEELRIDTGKKIPKPKGCFKLIIPDAVLGHLFTPTATGMIPVFDVAHRCGVEVLSSAQGGTLHTKLYPLGLHESIIQVIGTTENVPTATEQIVELYQGAPSLPLYLHLNYANAHAAATPPPPPTPPPSPTSSFLLDKGAFFAHPPPHQHFSDGILLSKNRSSREHLNRRSFSQGQIRPLFNSLSSPIEQPESFSALPTIHSAEEGQSSLSQFVEFDQLSLQAPGMWRPNYEGNKAGQATQRTESTHNEPVASRLHIDEEQNDRKLLSAEEPYNDHKDTSTIARDSLLSTLLQHLALSQQQLESSNNAKALPTTSTQSHRRASHNQQLGRQLPLASLGIQLRELQRQTEELERQVIAQLQQQTELLQIEQQQHLLRQQLQEQFLRQVLQLLRPDPSGTGESSSPKTQTKQNTATQNKCLLEQGGQWQGLVQEHHPTKEFNALEQKQATLPLLQNAIHKPKVLPANLGRECVNGPERHEDNIRQGEGCFENAYPCPSTVPRPDKLPPYETGAIDQSTILPIQQALNIAISKLNCIPSANGEAAKANQGVLDELQIPKRLDLVTNAST